MTKKILVTGAAGFIGYHLSKHLLEQGFELVGLDGMTSYYDIQLKRRRAQNLHQNPKFKMIEAMLEDTDAVQNCFETEKPDIVVHLAAQAGVRYSLENPRSYIDSNLVGTFNIIQYCKELAVEHLLMASTSSVYGGNDEMPFSETQKADLPLTIYAATKKANEAMAHSYAYLFAVPTTMFRFFTVYGPWGRPDMALFKFTKNIIEGLPIDVYNHGEMYRDFTYVTDLVRAIGLLVNEVPQKVEEREGPQHENDSLSPVAPFRVVNIGNSNKVKLLDFIKEIEACLGKQAVMNMMDMQPGDVPATWADCGLLFDLTGYKPNTDIQVGVRHFVDWYQDYYGVSSG